MRLILVDDEHAHDAAGELWVRLADRWRRASEPPPDAPLVIAQHPFDQDAIRHGARVDLLFAKDETPELRIDGRPPRGPWSLLVREPGRARYVDFP